MSRPITCADLVGCWPENPLFSANAEAAAPGERHELAEDDLYNDVADAIAAVPDPDPKQKHFEDCWKVHAPCLAERIGGLL